MRISLRRKRKNMHFKTLLIGKKMILMFVMLQLDVFQKMAWFFPGFQIFSFSYPPVSTRLKKWNPEILARCSPGDAHRPQVTPSGAQICPVCHVQPLTMAILIRPLKLADSQQLGEGLGGRKRRMGYWYWERSWAGSGCIGLLGQPSWEVSSYRKNYENEDDGKELRDEPGYEKEQDCICDDFVSGFFPHWFSIGLRL